MYSIISQKNIAKRIISFRQFISTSDEFKLHQYYLFLNMIQSDRCHINLSAHYLLFTSNAWSSFSYSIFIFSCTHNETTSEHTYVCTYVAKLDCTKINAHLKNSQLVYGRGSFTSGNIRTLLMQKQNLKLLFIFFFTVGSKMVITSDLQWLKFNLYYSLVSSCRRTQLHHKRHSKASQRITLREFISSKLHQYYLFLNLIQSDRSHMK